MKTQEGDGHDLEKIAAKAEALVEETQELAQLKKLMEEREEFILSGTGGKRMFARFGLPFFAWIVVPFIVFLKYAPAEETGIFLVMFPMFFVLSLLAHHHLYIKRRALLRSEFPVDKQLRINELYVLIELRKRDERYKATLNEATHEK